MQEIHKTKREEKEKEFSGFPPFSSVDLQMWTS